MADQKQQSSSKSPSQSQSPSPSKPSNEQQQQKGTQSQQQGGSSQVQGEGNYEAAKQYDDAQRRFVESGRVQEAARAAAPRSDQEKRDMQRAEQEGRSRAKEEDPALRGGAGGQGSGGDSQSH